MLGCAFVDALTGTAIADQDRGTYARLPVRSGRYPARVYVARKLFRGRG